MDEAQRHTGATAGIVVEGLTRSYGDFVAIRDVSFRVGAGEVVALLGPNGAGKTTCLRILSTLLRPDAGSATIDGIDVVAEPLRVRSRIGYHTGDTGLYERLTPVELLTYFGTLQGMASSALRARVDELVARFDIGEFRDRLCGQLSTGQKQRVSLARAMVQDPPVIILDEPTSGLDVFSSSFILETLREIASEGRAVLFSTHILSEVELIGNRVVVIHRGTVLADETVSEFVAKSGEPNLSRAFLRRVGDSHSDRLLGGGAA